MQANRNPSAAAADGRRRRPASRRCRSRSPARRPTRTGRRTRSATRGTSTATGQTTTARRQNPTTTYTHAGHLHAARARERPVRGLGDADVRSSTCCRDARAGRVALHASSSTRARRASATRRSTRGSRRSSCSASEERLRTSTRWRSRRCSPTQCSPSTTLSCSSRPRATRSTMTPSRPRSSATSARAAATSASTRPRTPSTCGRGTGRWSAATSATTRTGRPPQRSSSRTPRHHLDPPPAGRLAARGRVVQLPRRSSIPVVNGGGTDYSPRNSGVHVLLKMDESTYAEADGSDGVNDDHPISWCHRFDGGRAWYTGLGHTEASLRRAELPQARARRPTRSRPES